VGGRRRALARGGPQQRRAVVELQQCTGEPIERVASDDPVVIAYLRGVESDLDLT
jgi:hypothetical protein